jgi:DNA invertase Pin-like site-specific DNA recombinase
MHATPATPDDAYSYQRFSSPAQAHGDSIRRQNEKRDSWLARNPDVHFDTSLTLLDLGKSAFTGKHRENPDRHALAAFLKLVERGKVRRGSYLIVESLDRLTREDIQPALLLVLGLLQAGIRIVQLLPVEVVYTDKSPAMEVMMMIMELSRGHSESQMKSERVGSAWAEKKRCRREGKPQPARKEDRVNGMHLLTHTLPAWIEERGGKPVRIPERAAAVKRVFELALAGYGHQSIVKRLTAEGVPALGRSGRWVVSYVYLILSDRRVLGEHQPRVKRTGQPDGEAIPDYFPRVIDEDTWKATRGEIDGRKRRSAGRTGTRVNVFRGLLRNARDGGTYSATLRNDDGRKRQVLINFAARDGKTRYFTFPLDTFEVAILSRLRELDPHEVLNGDQGPDESLVLAGELASTEAELESVAADLATNGFSATLAAHLRALEQRKEDLCRRLDAARQKALHPLSESWGEVRPLVDFLSDTPDPEDTRIRLRSALRRIVDSIWLLVVKRGRDRLAAVQVWFKKDGNVRKVTNRDYLIFHRCPRANALCRVEGEWWVRDFAITAMPGDLDLRRRADAAKLEKALTAVPL